MPFLEAGLHGKPSVAFKHSALPEVVIHEKTGLLANTDEEFKLYLEKLIKDGTLRSKMGKEAKKHAGNFTWEECAANYEVVFKKLILDCCQVSRKAGNGPL